MLSQISLYKLRAERLLPAMPAEQRASLRPKNPVFFMRESQKLNTDAIRRLIRSFDFAPLMPFAPLLFASDRLLIRHAARGLACRFGLRSTRVLGSVPLRLDIPGPSAKARLQAVARDLLGLGLVRAAPRERPCERSSIPTVPA